jgi:hypothetical protein
MPPRFSYINNLTLGVNAPLDGVTYTQREIQLVMVLAWI